MPDPDTCYRAMLSRDARFDGWFFVAVSSTGIYCRPSCPAMTPRRERVSFYPTAAAAQAAGYRACLRCRPDASPGSPQWNLRADAAGRAMRLIADGVVDRDGVEGLARQLAYSPRQLRRLLQSELGAGPLALARAQRAQTARLLIETTDLPFADIAFAAGFASLRQFNDTVREIFARPPRELRRHARQRRSERGRGERGQGFGGNVQPQPGDITLRLPYRTPVDAAGLLRFFADRAVTGVEEADDDGLRRTLRLPHGVGIARLTPRDGHVEAELRLADLRDLAAAVGRCRALLDLDADPHAIDDSLGQDPLLAPLVHRAPGKRVPGAGDGAEIAVRAVLGQQVSLASARATATRLVERFGEPLAQPVGSLAAAFPSAEALADADPAGLPMPVARATAICSLSRAVAEGCIDLSPGADRAETRRLLLKIPGIGPWTAEYVAMRALADTDAFPASDLGVRRGLATLGEPGSANAAGELSQRWRPWRAYAVQHLWSLPAIQGQRDGRRVPR